MGITGVIGRGSCLLRAVQKRIFMRRMQQDCTVHPVRAYQLMRCADCLEGLGLDALLIPSEHEGSAFLEH